MRMSDEAFEAEVRRRAAVCQEQKRRRRRIFMTACPIAACLLLIVGAFIIRRPDRMLLANDEQTAMGAPAIAHDSNAARNDNEIAPKETQYRDEAANALFENHGNPQNAEEQPSSAIPDAEQQNLTISCRTQTVQKGTKQLEIQVTNHSDQSVILSAVQLMLSQQFADGTIVGYVYKHPEKETRVSVPAGGTVPFVLALDAYEDDLPEGSYTLCLGESEIHFTIA